jgi:hypothetical protein
VVCGQAAVEWSHLGISSFIFITCKLYKLAYVTHFTEINLNFLLLHSMSISKCPESFISAFLANLILTDFSLFGGAESFSDGKRSPRRTFRPGGDTDTNAYPSPPQNPADFLWLMTEEPHRTRRMAIMKAHPEVRVIIADEIPPFCAFALLRYASCSIESISVR